MYEIILEYPAERFIKSLDRDKQIKVRDILKKLAENPHKGKELVGKLGGLRSLRFDNFRVIYRVEDVKLIVLVLRIGYRRDIYFKKIGK
ncbi:MAG: type II toxin-antitoxin system RelE/ParE family toxin [Nanoarchaeota archaeon]